MSTWLQHLRVWPLRVRVSISMTSRDTSESLALSQRVVELAPDDASSWRLLARAQLRANRNQEALTSAERAIHLRPKDAIAWHCRAVALARLGRYDEAVAAFDHICTLDEYARKRVTRQAQMQGVDALIRVRRYEDALEVNDLILKRTPRNSGVWAQRGLIFREMRRPFEADLAFTHANELASRSFLASAQLAGYYEFRMRDTQRALAVCDAIEARFPHVSAVWMVRSQCFQHNRDYPNARYTVEQALAHGGATMAALISRAQLLNNHAIALIHLGQYAQALADLDESEHIAPGRATTLGNRGVIFGRIERYTEALHWLQAATDAEERNPRPANDGDLGAGARGHIWSDLRNEIAFALVCLGRMDEARAALSDLLTVDPWNGETLGLMGLIETTLGHTDAALSAFTTSLAIEPRCASTYASYAQLLVALGKTEEAARMIERSLKLDPFDVRSWKIKAQTLRAVRQDVAAVEAERYASAMLAEQSAQVDGYLHAQAPTSA